MFIRVRNRGFLDSIASRAKQELAQGAELSAYEHGQEKAELLKEIGEIDVNEVQKGIDTFALINSLKPTNTVSP